MPEKAKALLEIVEGKAGFAKWYKNKNHWWDDPSYGPLPTRPGPSADDLGDLARFEHAEAALRSELQTRFGNDSHWVEDLMEDFRGEHQEA